MRERGKSGGRFRFPGDRGPLRCSFCGKDHTHVARIIAGPGVYICAECIALCFTILQDEGPDPDMFRLAVRRADGSTGSVALERPPFSAGTRTSLRHCPRCGTWLAGEGLTECLHCAAALGPGRG